MLWSDVSGVEVSAGGETRMASLELLPTEDGAIQPDHPGVHDRGSLAPLHILKSLGSTGGTLPGEGCGNQARSCHDRCRSALRTVPRKVGEEVKLGQLG